MEILIVSATWLEARVIADEFTLTDNKDDKVKSFTFLDKKIDILVSGIGPVFTAYNLTRTLMFKSYDLVINTGICGSYSEELNIGEVVNVKTDLFGDLGIEQQEKFLTLFEAGFIHSDEFPFQKGLVCSTFGGFGNLRIVNGLTTCKSHGRESSIREIKSKYNADTESMEGAAVFYVSNLMNIPVCQLRAISNYVEPRNPLQWNIPLALENLRNEVILGLKSL